VLRFRCEEAEPVKLRRFKEAVNRITALEPVTSPTFFA
jgi:hypothetical protein